MNSLNELLRALKETSRTFYIPIVRLPDKLRKTLAAAYLCLRALDEIEDHTGINNASKVKLLHRISSILRTQIASDASTHLDFGTVFRPYQTKLPEVTLRIDQWLSSLPEDIAPRIWDASATMADRMAHWVERNWEIRTKVDLNRYTFDVAGSVGVLLCDVWSWFAGTQIDRTFAIQFGRGLQAVNILRNRVEDVQRQVDFFPHGWRQEHMFAYARSNLNSAREKVKSVPRDAFAFLFETPLLLAEATLRVLQDGKTKLTRSQVWEIVNRSGGRSR